jgi:hypothetical protein
MEMSCPGCISCNFCARPISARVSLSGRFSDTPSIRPAILPPGYSSRRWPRCSRRRSSWGDTVPAPGRVRAAVDDASSATILLFLRYRLHHEPLRSRLFRSRCSRGAASVLLTKLRTRPSLGAGLAADRVQRRGIWRWEWAGRMRCSRTGPPVTCASHDGSARSRDIVRPESAPDGGIHIEFAPA